MTSHVIQPCHWLMIKDTYVLCYTVNYSYVHYVLPPLLKQLELYVASTYIGIGKLKT